MNQVCNMIIAESNLIAIIREELKLELSHANGQTIENLEARLSDEVKLAEDEFPGIAKEIQSAMDEIKILVDKGHIFNVRKVIKKIVTGFDDIDMDTRRISKILSDIQDFYLKDKKSDSMS